MPPEPAGSGAADLLSGTDCCGGRPSSHEPAVGTCAGARGLFRRWEKPFERLYHLIAQNYGYETFRAIRALKEHLSWQRVGVLDIPELDVHVELTRGDFERIIADEIGRFDDAVDATLANARLASDEIDLVLRTGGSALIPAFAGILMRRFPAKVVEQDPFTSVAAGLAIADYYAFGRRA